MDDYLRFLEDCCVLLEKSYGLRDITSGELLDLNAQELSNIIESRANSMTVESRKALFVSHYEAVSNLSYLNGRMEYYSHHRIDFKGFPQLDRLKEALWVFNRRANVKEDFMEYPKFLVSLLETVERKFPELKSELSYRMLRVLVAMLAFKNYAEASIISNLLSDQLRRSA